MPRIMALIPQTGNIFRNIFWLLISGLHLMTSLVPAHAFVLLTSSYAAFSRQYELGTVYSFDYETSVLLNEPQGGLVAPSTPKDVGFKVNLKVNLVPVWQNPANGNEQIIEMKISLPQLSVKSRHGPSPSGFVPKPSKAAELQKELPFFLHRDTGVVRHVYFTPADTLTWVNIKKGIASLFQYQVRDMTTEESDSAGACLVKYALKKGKQLLQKTKERCRRDPAGDPAGNAEAVFYHTEKVLSADLSSSHETTYELDPDTATLKSGSSLERHVFRAAVRRSAGVEVIGKQVVHLKGKSPFKGKTYSDKSSSETLKMMSKHLRTSLITEGLTTQPEPKQCIACKSLKDLTATFRKSLSPSSLGTQSASIAFLRLVSKVRDGDLGTLKALVKDKKNANVLPQLLDILAACQTIPCHDTAKSVLHFDKTPTPSSSSSSTLQERYLLALSLGTHPLEYVIEDLLRLLKKGVSPPLVAQTVTLTIASMTKAFAAHPRNANQNIIPTVRTTFLRSLEECQAEPCILTYLLALQNLQSQATVPVLMAYAKGWSKKKAVAAARAMQTMPPEFINEKVRRDLRSILLEVDDQHDSSVRAMAAEILLRWKPDADVLADIMRMFKIKRAKDKELRTLILGHIRDLCEKNADMEKLVRDVLSSDHLSNYDILSQGVGLSSAFSRPLSESEWANASFHNMVETKGGVLKRSNVDVFIDVGDQRLRLLSFGMFAGGLSMFSGGEGEGGLGDDVDEDDDDEAHAGMEVALLGARMRPFEFFRGQGELMGHVWSGTASERTTALQGTAPLQDHLQLVPLQGGLTAEFSLSGAVSYDFAGQVQVSLWSRNAHSLVEIGAAVVTQGQARVDNSFVQTMLEFNVGSQTQLDLISDLDFSDEVTMCLQMVQPDSEVIDNVRKFERIPGTNYVLRKYKRKSSNIPGKTYVMNRKNTELCNRMFGQ